MEAMSDRRATGRAGTVGHTLGMTRWPETRYARNDDGLHIAYQVVGDGHHDIALLSSPYGIDMCWEDPGFAAAASRLCRLGRLVLLDWRGHGSSDPVPLGAPPTAETWIDDVRVVLDAAGSRRAHLIGCSTGGMLALLFAATHPARASSVMVMSSCARYVRADDYPLGAPQTAADDYGEWAGELWGSRDYGAFEVPSRAEDAEFLDWAARARRLYLSPLEARRNARWASQLDIRAACRAFGSRRW